MPLTSGGSGVLASLLPCCESMLRALGLWLTTSRGDQSGTAQNSSYTQQAHGLTGRVEGFEDAKGKAAGAGAPKVTHRGCRPHRAEEPAHRQRRGAGMGWAWA